MHRYQAFVLLLFMAFSRFGGGAEEGKKTRNSFVIVISARTLMPRDCLETFSHFVLLYLLMARRGKRRVSLLRGELMSFFQSGKLMMMVVAVEPRTNRPSQAIQDKEDRTAKGSSSDFVDWDNLSKAD